MKQRLLVAGVAAVLGFAASFAAAAYVVNAEYTDWERRGEQ